MSGNDIVFNMSNEFSGMKANLANLEKHLIPKAQVRAVNRTADIIQQDTVKVLLPKYIDRPTRWTLNAVMTRYAKQSNLSAQVLFKDTNYVNGKSSSNAAADYLNPLIEGGDRKLKNFEFRLRRGGRIRPTQFALPGADARLDRFGNISKSVSAHILRDVQSYIKEDGYDQNTRRKAVKYFMLPASPHKPIGIYYRQGKQLKQVIVFTDDAPNYEQRIPFYKNSNQLASKHISEVFRESVNYYKSKSVSY